jgi:catechol 2,3-dioxygenase-like lactoylglutathione lyase family enzyme
MIEQLDQLLELHDSGVLDRRQLLGALVALAFRHQSTPLAAAAVTPVLRRGRTLNHVTLSVGDIGRSRAFYEQLLGFAPRTQDPDGATFELENGALVLSSYGTEGGGDHPYGIDHFCVGVDGYEPENALTELRRQFPQATVSLENRNQIYIRDPDAARVQLCAVDYKPQ